MSETVELIKSMFGNSSRFQAVLHYYSGFTKLANPAIQDFICTQQHLDILPLLHCFYEAQDPTLCKLIKSRLTHSKISFNFELIPVDYLAIGYFVTSLLSVPSSDAPNLHIRIDNTDDHKLKLLLVELSKYSVTAGALPKRLELELYNTGSEGLKLMASHLKQSNVITELTMEYHDSAPSDLVHLAQALYTNSHLSKCKLIGRGTRRTYHYTKEGYCLAFSEMFRVNKSLTNFCFKGILLDLEARLIFKGLQCNTTLTHLDLSDCISLTAEATARELTTMLQVNKTLKHLDLSRNFMLKSCPMSYYVFQGLLHNKSLVHLNLSNVGLVATEDTIEALSKMLQVNNSLKHLDLSYNDYSDFGVSCIFQSLQHNTALVHLNLSNAKIKPTGNTLKALSKMLQVNKSLTHLNLSRNELSGSRLSCVFQSLRHNTTLVHLNLSHNYGFVFADAVQALYSRNCINKTLTHLNLSGIWGLKFHIIFRGLQHNTTLVQLYLHNTGLVATEDTTQALTTMLQVNKTLTHLNLSYNDKFSDSGALCVFEGLRHNTTLLYLDLSSTGLVKAPTTMLKDNKTLTILNLSFNWNSTFSKVHSICLSFQHNTSLVHLYLRDTGLTATEDTAQALTTMLQINKSLTHLALSHNKELSDSGAHYVSHATSLVYLDLSSTGITNKGAEYIAQAINSNHSLESLNIATNNITDDGFAYIAKSIETAPSLRTLYIHPNPVSHSNLVDPWRISMTNL